MFAFSAISTLSRICDTVTSCINSQLHASIPRAAERGAGGTMTPGPMDFRGPMGFRKGPIKMTLRNQHVKPKDFGDHLISTGKIVISVKTFFL